MSTISTKALRSIGKGFNKPADFTDVVNLLHQRKIALVECYCLFIESEAISVQELMERSETRLMLNPHYALCRQLGQLARVRVFKIDHSANKDYLLACQAEGKALGDIKPIKLSRTVGGGIYLEVSILVVN